MRLADMHGQPLRADLALACVLCARVSPEELAEYIHELEMERVAERSRPLLQQVLDRSAKGHFLLQRYSGVSALCQRPKGEQGSERVWADRRRFVEHVTDGITDEICGDDAFPGRLPRGFVLETMTERSAKLAAKD